MDSQLENNPESGEAMKISTHWATMDYVEVCFESRKTKKTITEIVQTKKEALAMIEELEGMVYALKNSKLVDD